MFDLDPGKLIVIGIVALIAIPSKDLPRVLRALGQMTGKMRRMSAEFQSQIMEAMREAELSDLKKEIDETNAAIMKGAGAFDPLGEARKQIASALEGEGGARSRPAATDHPLAIPHTEEQIKPSAASQDEGENPDAARKAAP